jgi:hypothetical protein
LLYVCCGRTSRNYVEKTPFPRGGIANFSLFFFPFYL